MKRRSPHTPVPKWRRRLGGALGAVVVGMVIFGAGVLARIILSRFYVLVGLHPAALVEPGIGAVLAILIVGAVVGTAGYLLSRGREQDFMTPLIDAMRRVSRGDFSVSLPVNDHQRSPLGPVASGLNEMTEALRNMEEMRREFVANVSHEIQSPLTSISGFAQALADTEVTDAERGRYLSIIESESKRLSRLSDDLLELTTLDSKELVVLRTCYSLARQLREVVLAYEPQWQEKSIVLDLALAELEIEADRDNPPQGSGRGSHRFPRLRHRPFARRTSASLRALLHGRPIADPQKAAAAEAGSDSQSSSASSSFTAER